MALLRIPGKFRRALTKLPTLQDSDLDEISAAIRAESVSTFNEETSARIASRVSHPDSDLVRLIAEALMSLYLAKCSGNRSPSDIANDVTATLRPENSQHSEDPVPIALGEADSERLTSILSKLLAVETFDISAKATGVLGEFGRLFADARVLTDARFIFDGGESPDNIVASVVVHNLKLAYFEQGELKSSYFALNESDVRSLMTALSRALKKDALIRTRLAASSIPVIE